MSDQTDEPEREKKEYKKPEMNQVALRPEEAVLASCKTSKVSGPGQGKCTVPSACSSLAS
jgi:hypothetical protein